MKGVIIDYQTVFGPDYGYREVIVIVYENPNEAKHQFIDAIQYSEGEKYVSKGLESMINHIILNDPEEYFTAEGWEFSLNDIKKLKQVPSNTASCNKFIIPLEGDKIIDLIFEIDGIVTELNNCIQVNLGIPSPYNANDIVSDVDLEDSDLFIEGISPLTLLRIMRKKALL